MFSCPPKYEQNYFSNPAIRSQDRIRKGFLCVFWMKKKQGNLFLKNFDLSVPATYIIYTFQDVLIAEHIKPCMHILAISISSVKHVIIRPTKTPKSADKKCQFLTSKVNFLCQKLSESFNFFSFKNVNLGAHLLLLAFFDNFDFKAL